MPKMPIAFYDDFSLRFFVFQQPCFAMDLNRITFDINQCGGLPCIRGMRIRVSDILDLLSSNLSAENILADYPDLEPEDFRACFAYAAREINHPVLPLANAPY
jgi:uncharacterized protein (DUF433 family)